MSWRERGGERREGAGALSRRRLLVQAGCGLSLACVGCHRSPPAAEPEGDSAPPTPEPACEAVAPGSEADGWVPILLADYPELESVGGAAAVSVDEALLHVVVVHYAPGCWAALWRVCTHGACDVEWDGTVLVCPCHSSEFDLDGAVLRGPATEALRAFPVTEEGGVLWVHRPL